MILGHSAQFLLSEKDRWVGTSIFILGDALGAAAFILLAGIGLAFSFNSQNRKVLEDPKYTKKHSIIHFWTRTLWILGIALIANLIGSAIIWEMTIWVWYVLFAIAIARIVCYPFLKTSPYFRLIIGLLFILLADTLRILLYTESTSSLFYILFNDVSSITPFPFFGFFFIGSAIGTWLIESKSEEIGSPYSSNKFNSKNLIIIGISLIVLGILIGSYLSNDFMARKLMYDLNFHKDLTLYYLPRVLVRGSTSWSILSLGIELILLAVLLQRDIQTSEEKLIQISERPPRGLILFGQYSFTIYLCHYLLFIIFPKNLSIPFYIISFILIFFIIHSVMWLWVNRWHAYGTIEWLIKITTLHFQEKVQT